MTEQQENRLRTVTELDAFASRYSASNPSIAAVIVLLAACVAAGAEEDMVRICHHAIALPLKEQIEEALAAYEGSVQ